MNTKPILPACDVAAQARKQHRENATRSQYKADRLRESSLGPIDGVDWEQVAYWQQDAQIEATLALSARRFRWGRLRG